MTPKMQSDETQLAVIQTDLTYIKEKLNAVDTKVSSHYVSKEEFDPIKKIVYGMVSLILIAVVGALVTLVVGAK
jgi:hypothetical protein